MDLRLKAEHSVTSNLSLTSFYYKNNIQSMTTRDLPSLASNSSYYFFVHYCLHFVVENIQNSHDILPGTELGTQTGGYQRTYNLPHPPSGEWGSSTHPPVMTRDTRRPTNSSPSWWWVGDTRTPDGQPFPVPPPPCWVEATRGPTSPQWWVEGTRGPTPPSDEWRAPQGLHPPVVSGGHQRVYTPSGEWREPEGLHPQWWVDGTKGPIPPVVRGGHQRAYTPSNEWRVLEGLHLPEVSGGHQRAYTPVMSEGHQRAYTPQWLVEGTRGPTPLPLPVVSGGHPRAYTPPPPVVNGGHQRAYTLLPLPVVSGGHQRAYNLQTSTRLYHS